MNFDILLFLAHSSPTRRIVLSYWQIQEQALRHGQLSLCLCRTHYVLGFPHAKACCKGSVPTGGACSVTCDREDIRPILRFKMEVHVATLKPCSSVLLKQQATTKHPKNCYFLLQLLIPLYCLVSKHMEEKRSAMCPFSQTQHPAPNA